MMKQLQHITFAGTKTTFVGVTRFFRENHTLSREMASQAALSMADLRRMM
jgi:hypothetical protein